MITYKNTFEEKIKPFLTYVGAIGAVFSGIMYILATIVLIMGFQAKTFTQAIVFAVVSAILGLIIMFFLRYQGLSFAKAIPENQEVLNKYNNKQAKTKHHTLKYFWIKNTIIDVLIKGCTVALSTAGIIYIVIEGSQDFKLILLAIANLILFACLGLIALANAYDFYNEQWVPYMNEQIELRNKPPEPEIQPRIDETTWVDKDTKNNFIMTSEAEFGTQG
jgi:hypothetical protein